MLLSVPIAFFIFGQAQADTCSEDAVGAFFLQTQVEGIKSRQRITLTQEPGSNLLVSSAADKIEATMTQMHKAWAEDAFWGRGEKQFHLPWCGKATPEELQMTIPGWQERHPGVRSFCHFSNYGFWFPEVQPPDYTVSKQETQSTSADKPSRGFLCESFGAVGGPEVSLRYDGLSFTWNHARDCIDLTDDPYCYSLGWLKGQNIDGALMKNKTAWHLLAKSECEKIQDEFQFVDEELTVGRHVESTPVYFSRTWNSLTGRGSGITRRIHKEHVAAKCQLGADSGEYVATEMAYCYYKACVLPGNRIGHTSECGY